MREPLRGHPPSFIRHQKSPLCGWLVSAPGDATSGCSSAIPQNGMDLTEQAVKVVQQGVEVVGAGFVAGGGEVDGEVFEGRAEFDGLEKLGGVFDTWLV